MGKDVKLGEDGLIRSPFEGEVIDAEREAGVWETRAREGEVRMLFEEKRVWRRWGKEEVEVEKEVKT